MCRSGEGPLVENTRLFAGLSGVMNRLSLRPSNFIKALGLPFICLAMFVVAGGHWAVLQSVAWGQMLWSYSQQEGSVVAGAQKTFSGDAPCSMCETIAQAKAQEKKAPAIFKMDKKTDLTLVAFDPLVSLPTPQEVFYPVVPGWLLTRSEAPPTPVPIVRA